MHVVETHQHSWETLVYINMELFFYVKYVGLLQVHPLKVTHPQVPCYTQKSPTMLKSRSNGNLVSLPASSTKGGERGVLKASGLD